MTLITEFITVFVGAALVIITASYAIKHSIKLAHYFGVSDTVLGMTVLAIGTSLPEIITHIVGSIKIVRHPPLMQELSGLVMGTSIGSDVFQATLLMGIVALIGMVTVKKKNLKPDLGGLIVAAIFLWSLAFNGMISRFEGVLLVAGYAYYLYYLQKTGRIEKVSKQKHQNPLLHGTVVLIAFTVMAVAANNVVDSSTVIIDSLPISASFFGVILLGIASALPELTTSVIAAFKKRGTIAGGILVGSNVTNPMFALGLGAVISGYTVPQVVAFYDLPFKIITSILLLYFFYKNATLKKSQAVFLVAVYLTYLFIRNLYFPMDVF